MHDLVSQTLAVYRVETFRDRLFSPLGPFKLSAFLPRFEGFSNDSRSHLPFHNNVCSNRAFLIPVLF